MSQNLNSFEFLTNFVLKLNTFHREHSGALPGHHAKGFTKMNLQISELEAFKDIEITLYVTDWTISIISTDLPLVSIDFLLVFLGFH